MCEKKNRTLETHKGAAPQPFNWPPVNFTLETNLALVAFRPYLLRIYFWTVSTIKFGTDGWRGVIGEDFTVENVRKVACAIARYVVRAEKPGAGVLVGYDTRNESEASARAAAEVVSMAGMPVWIAEKECPSPALSLLVKQRGAAGGIMITASHNPYQMERHEIQGELR